MEIRFTPEELKEAASRGKWQEVEANKPGTRNFLFQGKICKVCTHKGHPPRPISGKCEWRSAERQGQSYWELSWISYVCSHQRVQVMANGAVVFNPVLGDYAVLRDYVKDKRALPEGMGAVML